MSPQVIRTACNRDCPDACQLLATVEDGRLTRLQGDPDHPLTRGFLCYRTGRYAERQYAPDRLVAPLLRRNGTQVQISWDDAFAEIESRLRRVLASDGPAAICSIQTGGSLGITKGMTDLFFRLLGPVTAAVGDICGGAGTAAQEIDFGVSESHDVFDLQHSKNVILWGKNVGVSNIHLVPLLKECRAAGARIVCIDPVPPESGLPGLERIAPAPGRDVELALGAGRLLLERGLGALHVPVDHLEEYRALCMSRPVRAWADAAGVAAAEVELVADLLGAGPTSIQIGWGMQRRRRGARIVRAIDALAAVSGNLGIPGGGASFYYWRRRAFRTELFEGHAPARSIAVSRFGPELLEARDPALRFLWISCANPVASLPDSRTVARAIAATEFSVAVDTHPTDTTRHASLVLPCTTMLEHGDILGAYGHHWVQLSRPVVAPPDGVRSDLEIIQELAGRFGLENELGGSVEDLARRLLRPDVGFTVEDLRGTAQRNALAEPVLFADGRVPTPNGRVQLLHDHVEPDAPDAAREFWLFSSSHRRAQSSQWVADEQREGLLDARVHPESAHGLAEGAEARLANAMGEIRVRITHDARMRRDVILVPKSGRLDLGRAPNAIVPARSTDLGGGAAYLDVKVDLLPS